MKFDHRPPSKRITFNLRICKRNYYYINWISRYNCTPRECNFSANCTPRECNYKTQLNDIRRNHCIDRFLFRHGYWLRSFKRITIDLILLNPTKIRKFENFRMKKKMLKKWVNLNYPCTSLPIRTIFNSNKIEWLRVQLAFNCTPTFQISTNCTGASRPCNFAKLLISRAINR